MALPAMIQKAAENQTSRYAALSQSLANLGQQVGATLAQREYQRQAAEALPAMQESYRRAFGKIQQGFISEGYMDVLNTSMQFGSTQNPFLMGYIEQANKFAKEAGDARLSQGWQNIQMGRSAGAATGGGGAGLPAVNDTIVDAELPTDAGDINAPVEEMVGVEEPVDPVSQIMNLAQGETNQKFATSLGLAAESSADPAKEELRKEITKNFKDYNAERESKRRQQFNSRLFDASKTDTSNSYMIQGADRVIGKGIQGLYIKPGFEVSGLTSKGAPTYKKQDIDDVYVQLDGAVSKLNEGDLGNFFDNAGGVMNTQIKTEVVKGKKRLDKDTTVVKIVDNKGREYALPPDSDEIKRIRIAYDYVKNNPAIMRSFNASDVGYLYSPTPKSEGPTRELAKGMPALQQSAPASSFASQDDVINAVKAGQLTREQAKSILQNQFGYK